MKKLILFISCVILHINALHISKETLEKMDDMLTNVGKNCLEKLGVNEEVLALFRNGKEAVTREEKCFTACGLKEFGYTIENDQMQDTLGMSELLKNESPEFYEYVNWMTITCVAEVPPSDDECEYLGEIHNCHVRKTKELKLPAH